MQKRFLSFAAFAITAVVLFSSCSKDNKQGRYIPATAGIVVHLDGESLSTKLPWDEIKKNEMFKEMAADTTVPAFAKSVMENPENSGINTKSDLIFFMAKDSVGSYAAIEGFVKDEAKFKQFLSAANKNAKETVKDGYTYFADSKASVTYNKERFIIAASTPEMNMNRMAMGGMNDTASTVGMTDISRDMNTVTAMLFNLKEDATLAKNEKFTDLMKTKGDIHFWYSGEHFMPGGMPGMGGMGAMVNLEKLTKDAVTTATLSFDDGKISADFKSYAGKELAEIYKKYSGSSFDKTMVKNIPSKNLAGMFALNFKPEGIKEILKLLNMEGLANMGAGRLGFTLDDFVKANKGDVLVAVTDIGKDTAAGMNAKIIFSTSIGDKPSFNKLIDAGKKIAGPMTGGDDSKYSFSTNDKYFVFSNNKGTADTYLAGTANTSFDFMDKISGGPFGGYVNFQYIMNTVKTSGGGMDSLELAALDASLKVWDNLMISGGGFKDGGISQHWEVNLLDKSTNSLKQMNSYIGTIGAIEKKKQASRDAMWNSVGDEQSIMIDTVAAPTK